MTALALWFATSVLVSILAGRFIRAGMVDRKRRRQDMLEKRTVTVSKPTRYCRDARSRTADRETQP